MSCNEAPVDLHIHSSQSSDGDFSPFHIVQLAKKNKFQAISIADHDTVSAYPEAARFGREADVEVIPSVELTTLFQNREFHLLLPLVNWKKKAIKKIIARVSERRMEEAEERVLKLQKMGFDINWKEAVKKSKPHPPLGVTIAQILLEKAERTKDPRFQKYLEGKNRLFAPYFFYKDYFMEGKPASVPRRNISLVEILQTAPLTGGVPVIAHPGAYFQNTTRKDIAALKEEGLEGLEVYSSYHDGQQTNFYRQMAREFDLVPTAGSDFHGKIKPHIPFGSFKMGQYWMVEELKKRRR
ncbi:MAG: PHP domain-containing protein [Candidatus Aminicenantes bacterium]